MTRIDSLEKHLLEIHNSMATYVTKMAKTRDSGDLLAATLAAGSPAAVSHQAAAALYGMTGGRDDRIELTCVRWKRTIRSGLVVHESRRPVGGIEMGGKASYCHQKTLRLKRDDGELTEVAIDQETHVEKIA